MTTQQIEDKLKKIAAAKERISREEGARDLLLKQAKEQYGVDTIEGLQSLIDSKQKTLDALDSQIEDDIANLQEKYPQLFING